MVRKSYYQRQEITRIYQMEVEIDLQVFEQIMAGTHLKYKTMDDYIRDLDSQNQICWDDADLHDEDWGEVETTDTDLHEFEVDDINNLDDLKLTCFTTGNKDLFKTLQQIEQKIV